MSQQQGSQDFHQMLGTALGQRPSNPSQEPTYHEGLVKTGQKSRACRRTAPTEGRGHRSRQRPPRQGATTAQLAVGVEN